MKAHVRVLMAAVDPPVFSPFEKWGVYAFDYHLPPEFRVRFAGRVGVEFVAPAWMLLAHPRDFPRFHASAGFEWAN